MTAVAALRRLGPRAAGLMIAYGFTTLSTIAAIVLLRRHAAPGELQAFLGFVFVSALAASLDPGTGKAALMRAKAAGGEAVDRRAVLQASLLKSLAASLVMAVLWRVTDPTAAWPLLALAVPLTAAGFVATDHRVLLDFEGRHQRALWLKQGSLGSGVLAATAGLLAGLPIILAVALACAARLAWVALFLRLAAAPKAPPSQPAAPSDGLWPQLRDSRWTTVFAMSAISAMSGSADRVVVLRYLPASASGDYFLWYELLSKFWVLPYILAPILFARRLRGDGAGRVLRGALALGAVSGLGLTLAVPATAWLLGPLLPHPYDSVRLPVVLFTLGIALAAVTQMLASDLQGHGRLRPLLGALILTLVATPVIFAVGAARFGIDGVYIGWLVKSLLEAGLYLACYRLPARTA